MIVSIIVENEIDKLFVDSILQTSAFSQRFEVVEAGGRSSAISLARSYTSLPDRSVALLVDSETANARQVQEQQTLLDYLLTSVAPKWKASTFLAVPELEACLFSSPKVAALVFGGSVSADSMIRGRFEPKKTAMDLFAVNSPAGYAQALGQALTNATVISSLSTCSPFRELQQFVKEAPSAEWIARGFRWPHKVGLKLPDQSTITVEPSTDRSFLLRNQQTERDRSALRFYNVTDAAGQCLGEKSEPELSRMLGEQQGETAA